MVDFEDEIVKHLQWRTMIESMFRGQVSMTVPPAILLQDNHCQLGKWIYSEDSDRYASSSVFNQLISDHKEFHLIASKIVSAFQNGEMDETANLEREFYKISDAVVLDIKKLSELV